MLPETAASKVTAAHLSRTALLYIRQSSLKQVIHNTESAVRQYDLRGKAIALGWDASQITVIDIDQGQSGASAADREGFQQLVAEVSLGRAGIVLGLECSRLARNSADWHQLLELCGMTGTLICDEDGLYDPRNFNDRLLLGLKGALSEAELHFIRARLRGGQLSKARRGELIMPLPIGLVYDAAGHVILDPDTAIAGALRHLFTTFEATGSATAVREGVPRRRADLPLAAPQRTPQGRGRLAAAAPPRRAAGAAQSPLRRRVHLRPDHPAGPARREELLPAAAPRPVDLLHPRRPPRIHHPGPARSQHRQAGGQRRRARPRPRRRAAPRRTRAAAGHHHLRTLRAADDRPLPPRGDQELPTYTCHRDGIENGHGACTLIPGHTLDQRIGALLIDTLTPLAIEAALQVSAELQQRAAEADALRAAHVERARYHADLARRRYLAVDPANRLVAGTLEAGWNTALRALTDAQDAYDNARQQHTGQLTSAQKTRISQLVTDLPGIWNDPATPMRERKRIARLLLTDVTVTRTSDTITAHVRLAGGQHRTLTLPVPKRAWEIRQTPAATITEVDQLLDHHTCAEIAGILRRRGLANGEGKPLTATMVQRVIRTYQLRSRRQRLLAAGLIPLGEMAALLGVSTATVKIWYHAGIVTGQRYNDKGEVLYHPPGPNPPALHQGRRHDTVRPA